MNGAPPVEWLAPLLVGALGLLAGAVLVWRQWAGAAASAESHLQPLPVGRSSPEPRGAMAGLPAGGALETASSAELRDLACRGDALLQQLRELEDTAGKRNPAQLARERYALELQAATALLALEDAQAVASHSLADNSLAAHSLAASLPGANSRAARGRAQSLAARESALATAAAPPVRDRAAQRGFAWGAGSATAVLLLAFFVYQSASPRGAGGSVTGNVPGAAASEGSMGATAPGAAAAPADAEETALVAALARNPQDVESSLNLARLYVERENWMGVWNETGRVLARVPDQPRAMAYQSLVRLSMGQTDLAATMLKKAIAKDPDLIDAYAYLGLVYARAGKMPDAERALASGAQRFPDRAADFRGYLADLRKQAPVAPTDVAANPHQNLAAPAGGNAPAGAGPGAAPAVAATAPAGAGPGASSTSAGPGAARAGADPRVAANSAAGTAPGAGAAGPRVAGIIELDPSVAGSVPPGAVLFVFVRAAGAAGGPPVAARRLPPVFPATFALGQADSMMGQPFPEKLLVEARLDTDGDPTTRPPSDPTDRLDGVQAGRTDLRLVLKPR